MLKTSAFAMAAASLLIGGCGSAPKATGPAKTGDVELVQELSAARATYARGAWPQAASLYRLALKRAEVMDDPREIANTAFNLALTLAQMADYDGARAALQEAKPEASRAAAPTSDILALDEGGIRRFEHVPDFGDG